MNAIATPQSLKCRTARTQRILRVTHYALLACLLVLIAVLAQSVPAQAASNVQFGTEQNGGMDGEPNRSDLLDRQKDVGSSVIRYILRWDRIATCNPGATSTSPTAACYNFATPDAVADGAAKRGMQVIFSVYGVPSWVNGGRGETYTGGTDAEFNAFAANYANFVQAAVTRYNGRNGHARVQQWTIWNEPNGQFWTPLRDDAGNPIGPHRYAQLYDVASRRLKATDPNMLVAVGPTAPMARNFPPIQWAQIVASDLNTLGSPIDAWAHNGYMGTQSPFHHTIKSPYVGLGNVTDLTNLLDSFPHTRGLPVWITEFGYQTTPSFQPGVSPAQQALLVDDAMRFAYAHPRITTFIWYSVLDDNAQNGFKSGLYYDYNTCGQTVCPKPSAATFRHPLWVSDQANDLVTLWGRGGRAPAQTRIFVRPVGGAWHAYTNADTSTTGAVTLTLKLSGDVEAMTCDVVCGPMRTIVRGATSPIAAAATPAVKHSTLAAVRLGKKAALAKGIAFSIKCPAGCTVSSQIFAKGAVSGIAGAKAKRVLISTYSTKRVGGGRVVTLKFTKGARAQLARHQGHVKLIMQITVTGTSGTAVYQRSLTLV